MHTLILILIFCFSLPCVAEQWQLESQTPQVKVFSQNTDSGIKKVKAITTIKSRLGALLSLLEDVNNSSKWIDNVQKIELVERPQPAQAIVHSYFSAPWPVKDRDMITLSVTSINTQESQIKIDIRDYGDHYPNNKGYVRMHSVSGFWLITQLADNTIEIEYQGSADPAGHIPIWLANKILVSSTLKTFEQMRNIIVEPKYQKNDLGDE